LDKKGKLIVISSAIFVLMMPIFPMGTVKASPNVPTVSPSGDNPVNVIWRRNGYVGLVTASMIEIGWVWADLPYHEAFACLMRQDGVAGRWYIWIYRGGWDADWGYWSYACAGHYYWWFGWHVDSWEDAEDKVYNDWVSSSLPWSATFASCWLDNAGDYWGVYNDGNAIRIQVNEQASGEGNAEWTQNSKFLLSGYQWDPILYNWEWSAEGLFAGKNTTEVFEYDIYNHAWWNQNGVVDLAARDPDGTNIYGRSARITYGPFLDPYSDVLPSPVPISKVSMLKGTVSKYGSWDLPVELCWGGVKFDAWFKDPLNNNRTMVIEMYFQWDGWPLVGWGNEWFRTMGEGGKIDDHLIKLQAFPQYCNMIGDVYSYDPNRLIVWLGYTTFLIDLKGIWQRAAGHFGRSSDDLLYAVALDIESGGSTGYHGPNVIAEVNEIRVTFTNYPPNIPLTPSGNTSGYVNTTYSYSTKTTDPEGDDVQYEFDWGDSTTTTTGWYTSGTTATASHSWSSTGTYNVKVRAQDSMGAWSDWSSSLAVSIPVHDIRVMLVKVSTHFVRLGETVTISVLVDNEGERTETFTVTTDYNGTLIGRQTVTLIAEDREYVTFTWDTAGMAPGHYHITAVASVVPGETDTTDNTYSAGLSIYRVDVAVINVTASPTKVNIGESVTITVTVKNEGDIFRETFNVTAYYDSTAIGTQTVTSLIAGGSTTLTFTWNTAGMSPGKYTIKAVATTVPYETDTADNTYVYGTVNIEPTLVIILNALGFTNIEESTTETFIPGIYRVKLYAEFAGYHAENELSWYEVGTTQYNLIFSGPEGNLGYVNPPIVKTFTINSQFGLSFNSLGTRYFTETSKNPDGIKHAMIYRNLDNPNMYLIGFENTLGGGDQDYNDMVISLEREYHDVTVISVTPSPTSVRVGESVTITAVVENQGDYAETFNVTAITLEQLDIFWSMGDVNRDGYINEVDLNLIGEHSKIGVPYDPKYDINKDGAVDVYDLAICAGNDGLDFWTYFGLTPPQIVNLPVGTSSTVTFIWNTAGTSPRTYTIKAVADTVAGETDTADNTLTDGTVEVYWVHDVAVTSVTASPTKLNIGESVTITVKVENEGDYTEYIGVMVYNELTAIGVEDITLSAGGSTTLTFTWYTVGMWGHEAGTYTITADAICLYGGETDTADNTFVDGLVKVRIPGDGDFDGDVDMDDFYLWRQYFGASQWPSGIDPDYDNNGLVEMPDYYIWVNNFGLW